VCGSGSLANPHASRGVGVTHALAGANAPRPRAWTPVEAGCTATRESDHGMNHIGTGEKAGAIAEAVAQVTAEIEDLIAEAAEATNAKDLFRIARDIERRCYDSRVLSDRVIEVATGPTRMLQRPHLHGFDEAAVAGLAESIRDRARRAAVEERVESQAAMTAAAQAATRLREFVSTTEVEQQWAAHNWSADLQNTGSRCALAEATRQRKRADEIEDLVREVRDAVEGLDDLVRDVDFFDVEVDPEWIEGVAETKADARAVLVDAESRITGLRISADKEESDVAAEVMTKIDALVVTASGITDADDLRSIADEIRACLDDDRVNLPGATDDEWGGYANGFEADEVNRLADEIEQRADEGEDREA